MNELTEKKSLAGKISLICALTGLALFLFGWTTDDYLGSEVAFSLIVLRVVPVVAAAGILCGLTALRRKRVWIGVLLNLLLIGAVYMSYETTILCCVDPTPWVVN